MSERALAVEISQRVARVTLDRPQVHNAFDDALIAELRQALATIADDSGVRAVMLKARGKSFCAGADLNWMRRVADYDHAENVEDAGRLAAMLHALYALPKPTVALVQGAAYGGGVGLAACCDIVLAAPAATFSLSEIKLGLIPATISPFVVAAVGPRAARRLALTGERFDAAEARRLGLVNEVVEPDALAARGEALCAVLAGYGPQSLAGVKSLIDAVAARPIDASLHRETAERIAERRASDEGREGIRAFLEKRRPRWPD